jgi:hypothetical protein
MAVQVTTLEDGILLNTLEAPSMFPHFAYMSTKLFPHKNIGPTTTLNELFLNKPAVFKYS